MIVSFASYSVAKPCFYYDYVRSGTTLTSYVSMESPEACQVTIYHSILKKYYDDEIEAKMNEAKKKQNMWWFYLNFSLKYVAVKPILNKDWLMMGKCQLD